MKFGIFSNQQRHMTDVQASWDEDVREVLAAEQQGFDEAWISEHSGFPFLRDAVVSAEMFIAKLAAVTSRIKLGSAVRRIALEHPVGVAQQAAMCDHLTGGRYLFGFGHGGPAIGYEQRGIELAKTHEMMLESIQLVLRCWNEREPFDHNGPYYPGTAIDVWPKPAQQPRIPVAMATTQPHLLRYGAGAGFSLMTSQYARPETIRRLGDIWSAACDETGRDDGRTSIIAVRAIHLADTDEEAVHDIAPGWREHLEFNKRHFGPVFNEWVPAGGQLADLTYEYLLEEGLVFAGSADTVVDRIRHFHDVSGGFGTLLLVMGKNWGTFEQRERSMKIFATEIVPRLADLDDPIRLDVRSAAGHSAGVR